MTDQPPVAPDKVKTEFSLLQLLPNMLTIAAICAGISAIRFAAEGNFALAVALITLASILDGMDGSTARYLGSNSKIGAELDSLADFVNFGVAPPLVHVIYEPSHHGDRAFLLAAQNGVRGHHWPFGNMPPVEGITQADVMDIVAYIRRLQRENGID